MSRTRPDVTCTIPITREGLAQLSHRSSQTPQKAELYQIIEDSDKTEDEENTSLISEPKDNLYRLAQFVSNSIAVYFR